MPVPVYTYTPEGGGGGAPYKQDGACHTLQWIQKQFWYLSGCLASKDPQQQLLRDLFRVLSEKDTTENIVQFEN